MCPPRTSVASLSSSDNIVGNPLCHYPSKQMGAIATGAILSPCPHKGFLRQMIPFQVDNRPTSQFSFSPLTVSARCHLQRDETWQTWPRDNFLQPKGGRLLGSVPHINDSYVSWSCRKMSDYHFRSSDKLLLDYYSLFQVKACQKLQYMCHNSSRTVYNYTALTFIHLFQTK